MPRTAERLSLAFSIGGFYKSVLRLFRWLLCLDALLAFFGLFLSRFLIRSPLRIFADKKKISQKKSETNHHKLIYRTSLKSTKKTEYTGCTAIFSVKKFCATYIFRFKKRGGYRSLIPLLKFSALHLYRA